MRALLPLLLLAACKPEKPDDTAVPDDPGALRDGNLLGSLMGEDPFLFIADRDGEYLWTLPLDPENQCPQVNLARDGRTLLYNEFASDRNLDIGRVVRVDMQGRVVEEVDTPEAHHAFAELPDGTFAWLSVDLRSTDEWGDVVGDKVVERAPDGTLRDVFSTWDWLEPEENPNWDSGFYPQGWDWTHGDSLFYDTDRDAYLVSFRNINTVLMLDRSGTILDTFGGETSSYRTVPDEASPNYPHGAHLLADGHLLLTSTAQFDGEMVTWASELEPDAEAGELREVWTYGRDAGLYAITLGGATRMSNGNTLVNWGAGGVLREVTPEGEVTWELATDLGEYFGRATFLEGVAPAR